MPVDDLVVGQGLVPATGYGHQAHEILTGIATALFDEGDQVGPCLRQGLLRGQQHGARRFVDSLEGEQPVGPAAEGGSVGGRDTEQLREHRDRNGEGQVVDDLHRPPLDGPVEQAVHDGLDLRTHRSDHPRGERPQDEAAQARVIRRIGVQQTLGAVVRFEAGQFHPLVGGQVLGRLAQAPFVRVGRDVFEAGNDVVVAGEQPASDRVAPVHRVGLAQVREGRIGVANKSR